jgi:excisionase family DNA binding protein
MTDNRWASTDEIATHLGIRRDTVYKWIDRYDLPAHKVGRLWKFRKDEVDQWVLTNKQHRETQNDEGGIA